jgi:RNA-binding proteins (RRM domain)
VTTQVFVGRLSHQTTQEQIRQLFQPYGDITSVDLITDNTGHSRGFAFVTMDTHGAGKAITALHKKEVGGQNINVRTANPLGAGVGRWC